MSKNKRTTTHVKLFYKDGSSYNIRRAVIQEVNKKSVFINKESSVMKRESIDPQQPELGHVRVTKKHKQQWRIKKCCLDKIEFTDIDGEVITLYI